METIWSLFACRGFCAVILLALLAGGWPAAPTDLAGAPCPGMGSDDGVDADGGQQPLVLRGGKRRGTRLLVFLSGGSFGRTSALDSASRSRDQLDREASRARMLLLVPVAPEGSTSSVPFLEPAGEERVLDLIRAERQVGRVDPERVYLAGFGAGATAALGLAARHAELFAALAIWSGTPGPLWERLPGGGRRVVGLADDPVQRLVHVPVYLFTARDDRVLDRECLELFVDGMGAAAATSPAWSLQWEQGWGGHSLGNKGPRSGLRFLARQRRWRAP